MIADVWNRQQIIGAIVIIVAVVLFGLGMVLESHLLSIVAGIMALVWLVVLIAWRIIGGPSQGKPPGAV